MRENVPHCAKKHPQPSTPTRTLFSRWITFEQQDEHARAIQITKKTRTSICGCVHVSRVQDFILDVSVPRLRCIPAQDMQRNTPKLVDAHLGAAQEGFWKVCHRTKSS